MSKLPSITIDAGHGGKDPGAVGRTGQREKDIVLAVALRLASLLEAAGVRTHLTRSDDRFLELHERARLANEAGTDLFLSLHCNSAERWDATGFEVFTTPGQTDADEFATCLFLEFAKRFPSRPKRMDDKDGDPDKEASFAVLRLARMPAALFELDFVSNVAAAAWMAQPENQDAMAAALADGVLRHLDRATLPAKPESPSAQAAEEAGAGAPKKTLKERLRSLSTQLANLAEEA
jgi:N-acetylmuramoyl-L-alanine amidase